MSTHNSKILLVSGTGFLGSYLSRSLPPLFPELSFSSRKPSNESASSGNHISLRLEQPLSPQLTDLLERNRYTHVVLCAAVSDPNECVKDPELSQRVNVDAVKEMAGLLKKFGTKIIFFSSDLVFGGQKDLCTEEENTCPTTIYGRQKVAAEEFLQRECPDSLIFRVSKLMSLNPHPRNLLNPVLAALQQKQEAKLFTDQFTTPLFIEDIPTAISLSIKKNLRGIYHLGIRKKYSRLEMAKTLSELLGTNTEQIVPIQMKDFPFPEYRGPTNTLNSKKFEDVSGMQFRDFSDCLLDLKRNLSRF